MNKPVDFLIVGSGGGGGAIAWILARAGFRVMLLEQGERLDNPTRAQSFTSRRHDEYRYRVHRPDPKRRPRGDYNTFRRKTADVAKPLRDMGGWTGTALGGGSLLWGAWAVRPLPCDFQLATAMRALGRNLGDLASAGYSVVDWPVRFSEFVPYLNVAEALLATCGDRNATIENVLATPWYDALSASGALGNAADWKPSFPFPLPPYPETPVGRLFEWLGNQAHIPFVPLPTALVNPILKIGYATREQLGQALEAWSGDRPEFWKTRLDHLWSDRIRDACNLCGFCGEYICWGGRMPKSGSVASTLRELEDLGDTAEIRTNAKVYEVSYDDRTRRATGVRYLDVSDPDAPRPMEVRARHVILSCGAVQTARLLLMSGGPAGLANSSGAVGRYATYHLFGLGARYVLPIEFQGFLHAEFGHTGTRMSYGPYFLQDEGRWYKGGILTGIGRKNPLENASQLASRFSSGMRILNEAEKNARRVDIRFTGDDLPRWDCTVDLDPTYVDEYGLPVARITRPLGPEEEAVEKAVDRYLKTLFEPLTRRFSKRDEYRPVETIPDLLGDHQMGTCRMGDDPSRSVLDQWCRAHEIPNLFVVDTSFMPTGFGLNPMVTVVANALRVGTWIVEQHRKGLPIDQP